MSSGIQKKSVVLCALFLTSVLIQCAFLAVLPSAKQRQENPDYWNLYDPVAQNIRMGRGIVSPQGVAFTHYPPGYPLLLAGTYLLADGLGTDRLVTISGVNVFYFAGSCLFVFLSVELMFGGRIAFIAAVLWMTYPLGLWLMKQPNTEVPFVLFFYSCVWLFLAGLQKNRAALVFLAGVVAGLSALIRPIALFLGLLLTLALLVWKVESRPKRWGQAILPLAGFVLAILPWQVHLYQVTGSLKLLSTGGRTALLDGLTFGVQPEVCCVKQHVPANVVELMERVRKVRPEMETTGQVVTIMREEFRASPATVFELASIKVVRSWYGTYTMRQDFRILALQSLYLALGLMGISSVHRGRPGSGKWILFTSVIVLYYWGMAVMVTPLVRYLVPAMGLFFAFTAVPLERILARMFPRILPGESL